MNHHSHPNHYDDRQQGFDQHQHHHQQQQQAQHAPPQKWHSYKVLVDPLIHVGAPKMVRYDGTIVPGDPHHIPPNPLDPRSRLPNALWKRLEAMELPVPKFKVDENYVGDPPKIEVTIENLNDNVDSNFLHNLIVKFGPYEELCIHFHPLTRKHLGLARIVFDEVKSAKECVRQMHAKSVMGQNLNCYLDPRGASCRKMYLEMTEEKPEPVALPPPPPPPTQIIPEPPPPIPSGRTASLDDSSDEMSNEKRASHWERDRVAPSEVVSLDPRHISRRRDSSNNHRSDYSSRDRASERPANRWPESRDRARDRGGGSRDKHRDDSSSDRDRHNKSRHAHQDDFGYKSGSQIPPSFDPNYAQPDFWQLAAQQYVRQQVPPPPIPQHAVTESPSTSQVDESFDDTTTAEVKVVDSQVIDLDTRLKMLMKDKTGAMPAFLLQELNSGSDNDSDAEKKSKKVSEQKQDDDDLDAPLSRPPSPFLSAEHYYANLKNRATAGKKTGSKSNRPSSQNSDRMSLSSLSSGENNEILQQVTLPQDPYYGYYAQPPLPGQPPPPPLPNFPGTNGWTPGLYPPPPQFPGGNFSHPSFSGFLPQPHYPTWPGGNWVAPQVDPYSGYYDKPKKSDKSAYRSVISETVNSFVKELERALIKDIRKKMCETYAFYLYDQWWTEQEKKYKDRMLRQSGNHKPSSAVPPVGVPPTPLLISSTIISASSSNKENTSSNVLTDVASVIKQMPRIPKAEDLSTLFDQQRENIEANRGLAGGSFGAGGSLGFGFRGTIPKLPSFKRKPTTSAVTSRRDRPSTSHHSRRSDGLSSDEDSKHRSGGRRRTTSERRREHEQRREERLNKDKHKKELKEERQRAKEEEEKDLKLKSIRGSKVVDEEADSKVSSPAHNLSASRKTSSESSTSDSDISKTSQIKPDEKQRRKKKSKSASEASKSRSEATSGDESSTSSTVATRTSVESSGSSDEAETKKVEKKKRKAIAEKKQTSASDGVSAASQSSSSSSSSSTSAKSSSSGSSSSSSSSSDEEVEEKSEVSHDETIKKKGPTPVRRPSVAVSKIDEIPNGEIRDLIDIENDIDQDPRIESPAYMTDHCYARPVEEKEKEKSNEFVSPFANDHGYSRPRTPTLSGKVDDLGPAELPTVPVPKKDLIQSVRPKVVKPVEPVKAVEPVRPVKPVKPVKTITYSERANREEFEILYRFLTNGLDLEDVRYFQISYQMMLKREEMSKLLNYTHWVDHPVAEVPPAKRRKSDNDFSRPHLTGSCRTEGYYKMDPREKRRTKYHLQRPEAYEALSQQYRFANTEGSVTKAKGATSQSQSREARNNQRRQLAVLGDEAVYSDLLKFNQLKFRRKQLSFGKSAIHDWGLFAREDIGADEMVIEYVGHVIRPTLSDVREKRYEKQGIGSSYLFRIDLDYVVDATKCGNLARFINHSCDPNCYAKIITIDGEKKIVIYSKQPIAFGEEITYDYKFPIEDEKIHCLCGSKNCRKYLN